MTCGSVEAMTTADHLAKPDEHLKPENAQNYDRNHAERFGTDEVNLTASVLADLAHGGPAVEFAVGTGRIALPLVATGVKVHGIDFSEPMLAELRKKSGADQLDLVAGDMTTTQVCSDASLVYLVFNTITNLRTQDLQVACFKNAAAHLAPGGCFVIENGVPKLRQLSPVDRVRPAHMSEEHVCLDEYVDLVNQISVSHHFYVEGDTARTLSGAFRYVWPSELDLMAQLAGMRLESRWANWQRAEFADDSLSHISVYRKAPPS